MLRQSQRYCDCPPGIQSPATDAHLDNDRQMHLSNWCLGLTLHDGQRVSWFSFIDRPTAENLVKTVPSNGLKRPRFIVRHGCVEADRAVPEVAPLRAHLRRNGFCVQWLNRRTAEDFTHAFTITYIPSDNENDPTNTKIVVKKKGVVRVPVPS